MVCTEKDCVWHAAQAGSCEDFPGILHLSLPINMKCPGQNKSISVQVCVVFYMLRKERAVLLCTYRCMSSVTNAHCGWNERIQDVFCRTSGKYTVELNVLIFQSVTHSWETEKRSLLANTPQTTEQPKQNISMFSNSTTRLSWVHPKLFPLLSWIYLNYFLASRKKMVSVNVVMKLNLLFSTL